MPPPNPVSVDFVRKYLLRLDRVLKALDPQQVSAVGELLTAARADGRQVFLCGNGGSAALASHLATDLGKGCSRNRERRFRVVSLTDNVPWLTALANDISYDDVFIEQLRNYANPNDIFIAISSSGNSKNVLKAVQWANTHGCVTVGISGFAGGRLKEMVKHHVQVHSDHMGAIEDGQLIVGHLLVYGFMDAEGAG
jgi:D-sedoheptulose 7-phosphate isomerase